VVVPAGAVASSAVQQPPPLPVDVVTSTWDYIVGGVGIVSGLATAGALLIAAQAYRRQTENESRAQAALITLSLERDDDVGDVWILTMSNASNQPVVKTAEGLTFEGGVTRVPEATRREFPMIDAFSSQVIRLKSDDPAERPHCYLEFRDSAGRVWKRSAGGGLRHKRRERWWHKGRYRGTSS
jgi:hypothetical protein